MFASSWSCPHTLVGMQRDKGFKFYFGSSIKLNVHLSYDTTIPHSGIYPGETIMCIHKDSRGMSTETLLIIAPNCKEARCPLAREQRDKLSIFMQCNTTQQVKEINYSYT